MKANLERMKLGLTHFFPRKPSSRSRFIRLCFGKPGFLPDSSTRPVLPQCKCTTSVSPVQVNHQCFARPEIVVRVFSGRGRPSRSLKHRVWARFGNPQSSEPAARKSWDTGSTEIQNILSQFCPKRWFLSIFVLDKISTDYSDQLQCMRVSGGFQHDSEQRTLLRQISCSAWSFQHESDSLLKPISKYLRSETNS